MGVKSGVITAAAHVIMSTTGGQATNPASQYASYQNTSSRNSQTTSITNAAAKGAPAATGKK